MMLGTSASAYYLHAKIQLFTVIIVILCGSEDETNYYFFFGGGGGGEGGGSDPISLYMGVMRRWVRRWACCDQEVGLL